MFFAANRASLARLKALTLGLVGIVFLLVVITAFRHDYAYKQLKNPASHIPYIADDSEDENEPEKAKSKALEAKFSNELAPHVSIISIYPRPSSMSIPYITIKVGNLTKELKEATELVGTQFVLIRPELHFNLALAARYLPLFSQLGDNVAAIGIGSQEKLQFREDSGVLWISVENTEPTTKSDCMGVDLLETAFLIRTSKLRSLLSEYTVKSSLLELFYKLHMERNLVLSCSPDGIEDWRGASPFEDYSTAEWQFQAKNNLLAVIDERTDGYGRKHTDGAGIRYCNTTFSKEWLERFDSVSSTGKDMVNPRQALLEWKVVLDRVGLPLIISSGTLLGWKRHCNFIGYTSDIDTTLPIWAYTEELVDVALRSGWAIIQRFGKPGLDDPVGGCELALHHIPTNTKLDVFFNYHDKDGKEWTSLWTRPSEPDRVYFAPGILGDTQVADFLGIKLFIPKDPVEYLYSSYGAEWQIPKRAWQWDSSISNQHLPPHPRWPGIHHNVSVHPLVVAHRFNKTAALQAANRGLGFPAPS